MHRNRKRPRSDGPHDESLTRLIQRAAPSVAIFDLDSTLWDGNCENFTSATIVGPTEAVNHGTGRVLKLFPEVNDLLAEFAAAGVPLAIASASPTADTAARLLKSFGLMQHGIVHLEVHPGSKDVHLRAISTALKAPLERALFFDDLPHNLKAASSVGLGGAVLVRAGLKRADVHQALKLLRERSAGSALMRAWMGKPKQGLTVECSAPASGPGDGKPSSGVTPPSVASDATDPVAAPELRTCSGAASCSSANVPSAVSGVAVAALTPVAPLNSRSTCSASGLGEEGVYQHETVHFDDEDGSS